MAQKAGYRNIFISDRPRNLKNTTCHSRQAVKKSWSLERFEMAINGQVPAREIFADKAKNFSKYVLREGGYNFLRSTYLKLFK